MLVKRYIVSHGDVLNVEGQHDEIGILGIILFHQDLLKGESAVYDVLAT